MSSGTQISDIVLPPEIKDDFQVRDISSQFQSQTSLQTSVVRAGNNIHTGTATSSNGIHLTLAADEGSAPSDLAAQLVQLIRTSLNSSENLAKAPLIELLKRQAEQVPATAYQQTIPVWQLADDEHVHQALQQQIQQPGFGKESDAVCGWLYDWSRSGDPLLQRFVACIAPHLATQYLLHCHSTTESEPVPGLEACLIAIYELKTSTADIFRLPDVSQPSVYHQPASSHTGKADSSQGLYRQTSSLLPVSPTYSILPSGVAALFGSNKAGQSKVISGVHAWQRSAVAGAALQMFTSWMVTFTDTAMAGYAELALSLASCGCPWLQAEAQRLLQEQVHVHAQTTHSPNLGPAHRLRISPELLDPLCHGLGHAIYRLVMASTQQSSTGPAGRQGLAESAYQHTGLAAGAASSGPALLSLVAEAVAGLHARTSYEVSAEGLLLTQSLMAQLHQLYHRAP